MELSSHLEGHDQVSEMKLCFQIQLDEDVRLSWEKKSDKEQEVHKLFPCIQN